MDDRKYLEWHGQQWRVQVKVPRTLRAHLGTARVIVPLHTDSLANARRLRHAIVHEIQQRIEDARLEVAYRQQGPVDKAAQEALAWKDDVESGRAPPDTGAGLEQRLSEIERRYGKDKAQYFRKVAGGAAIPISALIPKWLAERDMKPRQKLDYTRAVRKFHAWTRANGLNGAIAEVTRNVAGRYISDGLVGRNVHWKTANKDISALSSYWRWLQKRGYLDLNVWERQSLPKVQPHTEGQRSKRPFTDEEVVRLLHGIGAGLVYDAMLIAALSGLRTEEIAQLRVADCAGSVFNIRAAKTAAGVREVPIHEDLGALILRRCGRKHPLDYLFHELKDPRPGSAVERGQTITKRFVAERRRLGVDERMPGRRQSRIDFHSFRRWFIAKARDALQNGATGFDQWTICEVVGHDKEVTTLGMTMGRYAGRQTTDARRACIASVKLPVAVKRSVASVG